MFIGLKIWAQSASPTSHSEVGNKRPPSVLAHREGPCESYMENWEKLTHEFYV